MNTWLVMLGVGLGSLLFRLVPMLVLGRFQISVRTERLIADAGTAALSSLLVVLARHAAEGAPAAAVVAALAGGVVLAVRRAPMPAVLAAGASMYIVAIVMLHAWGT